MDKAVTMSEATDGRLKRYMRDPSFVNFYNTIKSPETKIMYVGHMERYMKHMKVKKFSDLLKQDRKKIQSNISKFLADKSGELRAKTLGLYVSALWHFYTYNDVTDINWVLIRGSLKEHQRAVKDRAYSVKEIRTMLTNANLKMKVIVLLMASTGMRVGSIPSLTIGNLQEVNRLYKITVYERTEQEYFTFCTPECRQAINDYIDYRKRQSEEVTNASPLIRETFNTGSAKSPKFITRAAINNLVSELLIKSGLRNVKEDRHERHETMMNHAFRKFYETTLIIAGVSPVVIDLLLGHHLKGTHGNYAKIPEDELLKIYLGVSDKLTFFAESKLKEEVKQLQAKVSREAMLQEQIDELKRQQQAAATNFAELLGSDPDKMAANLQRFLAWQKKALSTP